MPLNYRISAIALLFASCTVYCSAAQRSYAGSASTFSLSEKTQIPGGTLKPGQYSIHVIDQLSDRMIVRIDSSTSSEHSLFLGIPHTAFDDAVDNGPVTWKSGTPGAATLRGFEFPNGAAVEFVYPKTEAVALAKSNSAKVVAVDPESEGRPVLKKMSQDDMQVVTLWTLSLTTAGADNKTPAIQAQRYTSEAATDNTTLANKETAAPVSTSVPHSTQVASLEQPAPSSQKIAPVPQAKVHHVIAQLPHTASPLPLLWIVGLFCLLSAGALRTWRLLLKRPSLRA